ncbi:MAG: hypothetical protein HN542_05930 [Flavobacteriales bacterium]|nr:hypothetical protein [Flavobacteriales bacterium]MBT5132618.1 hypothetical protein [Flavobacteriales bacterium]MBT6916466.1 hypothetical protein [Flavobacteriales bacterium]
MPQVYKIIPPGIPSAGRYYFTTESGVKYEVRFGRKQNNVLSVNIVFGVLNDEYEGEEYVLTNRGEFYSVMATIEKIIEDFRSNNANVHTFEFAGEPVSKRPKSNAPTKRTKVYMKWAVKIFSADQWKITQVGNKVTIKRLRS